MSLRERLPRLVEPALGLGVYDPVPGRVLGTRLDEKPARALAAAARALKAGKARAALEALADAPDCAASRWLKAYALERLARRAEADAAAHAAMELFSELAPEPLLGAAVLRESARVEVGPRTLAVLAPALRGPRAVWALALRAETLREPRFNRYAEAAADLRRAARLAPSRGWVWAHLGRALDGVGDAAGAEKALDRAVSLSPASGWIRAWRGQFRSLRRRPGALEDLDAAVALDPSYPFSHAWRGGALRAAGRPAEAEAALRVSLGLLPCYEWTHAELFRTLKAMGRLPEAAAAAVGAHERDPKYAWCRRDDADARGAALAELSRARRRSPRDPYLKAWEAWCRLGGRDVAGALRALGKPSLREPAFLLAVRGEAALLSGDARSAVRLLSTASKLRSVSPYLGSLGLARLEAGDARGAAKALAEAISRNGATAPYLKGLAGAQAALGRFALARETAQRALGLDARDAELQARLAEILYLSGRAGEALEWLARAGWRAPTPLPGASRRAKAWRLAWSGADARGRGRLDEAARRLSASLRLDGSAPWSLAWLGECRLAQGRAQEAETRLTAAVSRWPGLALARLWRGEARLRLGRVEDALADFRAAAALDKGLSRATLGQAAALEALGRPVEARRLARRVTKGTVPFVAPRGES
ncbi:MAG: tetratricopeptide repeat protein [Elusimicrobiota bacterium]|nr:tetratricopeptide repeat protein [Elusimicrobiota bacterium]